MTEEEVRQLLEMTRAGDPQAKDRLLQETSGRLLGLCHEMVAPYPQLNADDVFQEAVLKLHSAVDDLPSGEVASFLSLCAMIVRQVLLDMTRERWL